MFCSTKITFLSILNSRYFSFLFFIFKSFFLHARNDLSALQIHALCRQLLFCSWTVRALYSRVAVTCQYHWCSLWWLCILCMWTHQWIYHDLRRRLNWCCHAIFSDEDACDSRRLLEAIHLSKGKEYRLPPEPFGISWRDLLPLGEDELLS